MVLSLRSGITKEVEWALDRLVRLSHNEQFSLKSMPGLLDALFEWPYHYISSVKSGTHYPEVMFAVPLEEKQSRRFGLTSLFVLKNASVNDVNARELAKHPRTVSLVYSALMGLQPDQDSDIEFLVNSIEIFQTIAHLLFFPTPALLTTIIQRLETIVEGTSNRSLLICCISAITSVMQYTRNLSLFNTESSPSFEASIRCLPLVVDVPLLSTCLEYLYVRLSHPPLLRAFLLHPSLANTLKILCTIIIATQELEDAALDVVLPTETLSTPEPERPNYEMTPEEMSRLSNLAEPQRSYDWYVVSYSWKDP
jgi:chromatin structure-remodeling complex subunit RSC9